MKKGYKTGSIVIVVLIIAILGAYVYSRFYYKPHKKSGFSVVVDKIDKFSYTLDKRDSKLMRDKFKELKEVLDEDDINYEKYSKLLAMLYIIDLYNIDNKVNKYDVPCLEYIYKNEQDKFKLMIKENFYSKLIDNSDEERKQELPVVTDINVVDYKEDKVMLGNEDKDGYVVTLEWTYEKDLGFDKKAEVTLAKDNGKLFVVKETPIMN